MFKKFYSVVLILSLFAFLFGANVNTKALAQHPGAFVRLVRSMSVDKTGISNPAGIVFSTQSNNFHVVGANVQGQQQPASQDIIQLDSFANRSGSARIAAVDDPLNMAFDNKLGRLLSYQAKTETLTEVKQDLAGGLDPASLISHDVRRLGLQAPQGMSVDEASGDLFILDKGGSRIVRVGLGSNTNLDTASVSVVDLRAVGTSNLRGLAVDPSTGHFFVVSPDEQNLYELTQTGDVEAVRDLSTFGLVNPQGMAFAPSGDQTDDPTIMSLYLADSGNPTTQTLGQVVELSMIPPAAPAAASFSSVLVKTTDLSLIDPPSPDATGLAYIPSSNTLVFSDSDVEETKQGITHYQGVNVWELTLGGSVVYTTTVSTVPPTLVAMSDEPTGVAWNPSAGHYYFSDDNAAKVFDLNPGVDTLLGTADDSWTSFSVLDDGVGDAEGITYDGALDRLFVVDGTNAEVYQFSLGGSLISHFDVLQYGVVAPQSVEYNSDSGTLFVLEDGPNDIIIETTINGLLLRTIDYSAVPNIDPGGLVFAPASDDPGNPDVHRFYIVDRGIDNNFDPNIIDGKMYEITAPPPITPGNTPPVVDAGPNQIITLPTNSANLNGTVTDDGLPDPPGEFTTLWSQLSGPCTVAFGDEDAVDTTAGSLYAGRYLLRLAASDSELDAWDTVTVDVNRPLNTKVFDARLEASSDDAEESLSGGMIRTDGRLQLGQKDGVAQTEGFRFNWLGIPQGATIINATIQFKTAQATSAATSLTIKGQAANNAPTFTNILHDITTRPTTTAVVPWSPPAWNTVGEQGSAQRTPNLASVVQEIVNRPGWVSGNSMVFIITGTGERVAYSYDGDRCGAAVLHIEYDIPPVADADGPYQGTTGVPIQFDGTGSSDVDGTITTYQWDFGDGQAGSGAAPTHAYTTAGDYTVTLTVTDNNGLTDDDQTTVTVANALIYLPFIAK